MNVESQLLPRVDPARARPHRRPLAATVLLCGAMSMSTLCEIAHCQEEPAGIRRLVAVDAARLLHASDPVVRGEAALIVADTTSLTFHGALLEAAADPDPAARGRAIIALGLQATPGTAVVLDELLAKASDRTSPDGIAAAFALGLLPPDNAPAVTSRVLTGFLHGNLRRQREPLLALLLGMSLRDPHSQVAALSRLFDDDSTRDAQLRAQLLQLLLRGDHAFDTQRLQRLLERGSTEERATLLRWLACNDTTGDAELLPDIERAARAADPTLRTAALGALTHRRHLPALELAARALRSNDAAECGQAMRSVLAIGGAGMRGALERHLLDERDPVRKAALLANYDAPPSTMLLDHIAALAVDRAQPFDVRTAAAMLLARSDAARADVVLRDLFRATTRADSLPQLAALLLRDGTTEPPPLARLLDGSSDLQQHPARWQALLAAEHPAAVRQLLTALNGVSAPAVQAMALQAWRRARVLALPRPVVGEAPQVLRELLGS